MSTKAYLISIFNTSDGSTTYMTASESAEYVTRYRAKTHVYATVAVGEGKGYSEALFALGADWSVGALIRRYTSIPGLETDTMDLIAEGYHDAQKRNADEKCTSPRVEDERMKDRDGNYLFLNGDQRRYVFAVDYAPVKPGTITVRVDDVDVRPFASTHDGTVGKIERLDDNLFDNLFALNLTCEGHIILRATLRTPCAMFVTYEYEPQ